MTGAHPVESVADLATLIRQARQSNGMSQQSLADRIGTTRQWVIRVEQGRTSCTMSTVLAALSALGLEVVAVCDLD